VAEPLLFGHGRLLIMGRRQPSLPVSRGCA
jgi:hypothetical protein